MSELCESLVHTLETAEAEVSYDAWLYAKVARNLADPRARLPHEEVERRMAERIVSLKSG